MRIIHSLKYSNIIFLIWQALFPDTPAPLSLTHSTLSIYTHFIAIQCLPAYDLPGSARQILWMDASDLHFCASAHHWHISACLYNREFLGFPVTKY